MASDLVRFSVAVPEPLLEEFDAYTARRGQAANETSSESIWWRMTSPPPIQKWWVA